MLLFPNGEHDDLADSMTQAILRFRQGGFIVTPQLTIMMMTIMNLEAQENIIRR